MGGQLLSERESGLDKWRGFVWDQQKKRHRHLTWFGIIANPSGSVQIETIIQIVHIITSIPISIKPCCPSPLAQLCPAAN